MAALPGARVDTPDLLARIPYFRALPGSQRVALARRVRSVGFAPRQRMTLRSVRARLGRLVPDEAVRAGRSVREGVEITLPGTRDEIAARVGTVREPLSRALAALAREGLITVRGRRLVVRDVKGLEEAAGGNA